MSKEHCCKRKQIFLCVMLVVFCYLFTGCKLGSAVTITIADKEVPMNETLQKCIDNGLITTDASGNPKTLTTTFKPWEASFRSFHLGNSDYPHKCPITVMCYNPSDSSESVYGSRVMTLFYNLESDNADQAQVVINGIDFWGMTEDDALKALKDKGIKVDSDTMHDSHYIKFETRKVSWKIESKLGSNFDGTSDSPQKAVVDFDDNTYYVSMVRLSIANALKLRFE